MSPCATCTPWRATPAESSRQPRVAYQDDAARIERHLRIRLLEDAISELLQSETNGSLAIGVSGNDCPPLIVTAVGSSVLVAVGVGSVLTTTASLRRPSALGSRMLAEGCDRALRTVHRLPVDFTPTLNFADPTNARRFLARGG